MLCRSVEDGTGRNPKKVELMKYMNEHPEQFGIYHFAREWCEVAEIEFKQTENYISWKYYEGKKSAIFYKKPRRIDGIVYFGEIWDKSATCKRKLINTRGALAFMDEATKAMEELRQNKIKED